MDVVYVEMGLPVIVCVALLVGATVLVTVAVLVMEGSDALGVGAELKLGVSEGGIKIV